MANPQVRLDPADEKRLRELGKKLRRPAYCREAISAMLARHGDAEILRWIVEDRGATSEEEFDWESWSLKVRTGGKDEIRADRV